MLCYRHEYVVIRNMFKALSKYTRHVEYLHKCYLNRLQAVLYTPTFRRVIIPSHNPTLGRYDSSYDQG